MPSPSGPFPAVLCPSIGRPGGAGVRRLGCRGAAAGLLSALPRHSSCSIVPIPMPFSSPISIQGLFWRISPWSWFPRLLWSLLHSLLQASTAFCSWCCRPRGHGVRSSPSLSPSLCGRVTLSVGVHSVYAPVGESGGLLASFDLREAYIPVPVHPASRPFLRFLFP